jgi:hypothetical protein
MQNLVEKQAYKFSLSHTFRIHNVFHVFLLKSFKKRFDEMITSFSIMINEEKHDEMKLILNNKLYRKRLQYLVKWLSWSNIENQWIYVDDVQADDLIKNFHQQNFFKSSEDASNAKKRRIENNWLIKKKISLYRRKINYDKTRINYFSKFKLKSCISRMFRLTKTRSEFAIFFIKNNFFSWIRIVSLSISSAFFQLFRSRFQTVKYDCKIARFFINVFVDISSTRKTTRTSNNW